MRELPRGTSEVPARGGLSHTLLGVHCGPSYDSRSYPRELWWCTGCRTWSSWTRASPPAGSSVCSSACLQTPGVVKAFPGLFSPKCHWARYCLSSGPGASSPPNPILWWPAAGYPPIPRLGPLCFSFSKTLTPNLRCP